MRCRYFALVNRVCWRARSRPCWPCLSQQCAPRRWQSSLFCRHRFESLLAQLQANDPGEPGMLPQDGPCCSLILFLSIAFYVGGRCEAQGKCWRRNASGGPRSMLRPSCSRFCVRSALCIEASSPAHQLGPGNVTVHLPLAQHYSGRARIAGMAALNSVAHETRLKIQYWSLGEPA